MDSRGGHVVGERCASVGSVCARAGPVHCVAHTSMFVSTCVPVWACASVVCLLMCLGEHVFVSVCVWCVAVCLCVCMNVL